MAPPLTCWTTSPRSTKSCVRDMFRPRPRIQRNVDHQALDNRTVSAASIGRWPDVARRQMSSGTRVAKYRAPGPAARATDAGTCR